MDTEPARAGSRDVYTWRPSDLPNIRVIDAAQPVVNLDPGTLLFAGNIQLGVFSREATTFGIRLTFPKVVYFDHEGMETPHADTEFDNFKLFHALTSKLRTLTRPCRVESPARVHKPGARMSDAAKADLRGRQYFPEHSLTIL